MQVAPAQTALVRVLEVRRQNHRDGAIFRGERISAKGEILDTHSRLTVRLQRMSVCVPVKEGQWWQVTGRVTTDSYINDRGFQMVEEQMDVTGTDASVIKPSGFSIVNYIAKNSRMKGIGPQAARKLWERFENGLFDVLDQSDTEALALVLGIERATLLVEVWHQDGLSETLQWLSKHGMESRIGHRVLGYFGKDAAAKLTENPYRLLSFAAGWKQVDEFAKAEMGVALDDERRLVAANEEVVFKALSLGDTYVPHANLVSGLRAVLKGEKHTATLIDKAIAQSAQTGRLLFDSQDNVYSLGACLLEKAVAQGIRKRVGLKKPSCNVDAVIAAYEDRESTTRSRFELNQEQRAAVHLVAQHDFAVVTGGAGCGKTTVIKCVIEVLEEEGYDISLLALAGKAAKRIRDATDHEARTLASFIKAMQKEKEEKEKGQVASSQKRKALVIDEASMVDLLTFAAILDLIDDDTKIIKVGDQHQLNPVGPGLVFHCLPELDWIPHVELKVPKRFGNEIAEIANMIKDGIFPATDRFNGSVIFTEASEASLSDLGSSLYLQQPNDTIILCTTRKLAASINAQVQQALTARGRALRLYDPFSEQWQWCGFHLGDQIICTRNHWELGIQNGSLGTLVEIFDHPTLLDSDEDDDAPALGWIEWDDGEKRPLREDLLDSLELGYALTVHKSQGSQWRRVIVCLPTASGKGSTLVDRSMVYTAVTRAKSQVVLCGNHDDLVAAIERKKAADRRKVGLPNWLAQSALN